MIKMSKVCLNIFPNFQSRKKIWHSESKQKTIICALFVTKNELPFKNELDYQIKPLKPAFFLITSVVTCTLYFGALIIGLFKICLVIDQTPGMGRLSNVFFDLSRVN